MAARYQCSSRYCRAVESISIPAVGEQALQVEEAEPAAVSADASHAERHRTTTEGRHIGMTCLKMIRGVEAPMTRTAST